MTDADGEWEEPTSGTAEPGETDTWEERIACTVRLGPDFESPSVGVQEWQYPDEDSASIQGFRDDTDPRAVTTEDVPMGDDALYTTYVAPDGMPPFASYSIIMQDGDRWVRVAIREPRDDLTFGQAPAEENERRAQLDKIVELLGP